MKLAKFLLNCLLFVITFVIMIAAQWGVSSLLCLEAGSDVEKINFKRTEEEVSYFDVPTFLVEDLKTGYATEEFHSIRNWFKWEWWKNGMRWADIALTKVVVTFKAVFLPVADIDDLRENHIEGYQEEWSEYYNWHYILESDEYIKSIGLDPEKIHNEGYNELDEDYSTYLNYYLSPIWACSTSNPEMLTQSDFVDEYADQYRFIRLATHFNTEAMQTYYNKFIDSDGDIKFSTISVYMQILVAFIFSCWFLHNNKFKLRRNEETDENEVEGGYKGFNLPGFKKKKKKDKKKAKK